MIAGHMIGARRHLRAGIQPGPRDRRHFITPLVGFLAPMIGDVAATIGATALTGAAVGAGGAALSGGNVLKGALMGGVTGGALGGLTGPVADLFGIGNGAAGALVGGATNAALSAATGGNPLMGGIEGALGGYAYGSGPGSAAVNPASVPTGTGSTTGAMTGSAEFNPGAASGADSAAYPTATTPPSNPAAGAGNPTAGGILGGKLGNTSQALGLLSALGSALSKPRMGTWATPSPSSTQQGPYFNQPLAAGSAPGRTAVNPLPQGTPPNYWSYGAGPLNFFQGNTLSNYGFARGGALNLAHGGHPVANDEQHFSTGSGHHYVQGRGDGQSDDVPAKLSDGEFVFDATTVSRLGNGSNRRGAQMLEEARRAIAHDAGSDRVVQKKVRKSPLEYLHEARGKAA